MQSITPVYDMDDWLANRPQHLRCTVLSVINFDGSHPTGFLLGLDFRPAIERRGPAVYWVRLDGEDEPRQYQRHEIDF